MSGLGPPANGVVSNATCVCSRYWKFRTTANVLARQDFDSKSVASRYGKAHVICIKDIPRRFKFSSKRGNRKSLTRYSRTETCIHGQCSRLATRHSTEHKTNGRVQLWPRKFKSSSYCATKHRWIPNGHKHSSSPLASESYPSFGWCWNPPRVASDSSGLSGQPRDLPKPYVFSQLHRNCYCNEVQKVLTGMLMQHKYAEEPKHGGGDKVHYPGGSKNSGELMNSLDWMTFWQPKRGHCNAQPPNPTWRLQIAETKKRIFHLETCRKSECMLPNQGKQPQTPLGRDELYK